MTRDLDLLHGSQVRERLHFEVLELAPEDRHFVGHVDSSPIGEVQKLVDLRLDLDNVALKL